jgi:hypothetical protein
VHQVDAVQLKTRAIGHRQVVAATDRRGLR